MPLFQNSVLKKYLKTLNHERVGEAYQRYAQHFHNSAIQVNIRSAKEEQYQREFLIDLLVKVLGYTKNPQPDFNLTKVLKNVKDGKKADGAILKGETALAVIELKGTDTTDLGKVESQVLNYYNTKQITLNGNLPTLTNAIHNYLGVLIFFNPYCNIFRIFL